MERQLRKYCNNFLIVILLYLWSDLSKDYGSCLDVENKKIPANSEHSIGIRRYGRVNLVSLVEL